MNTAWQISEGLPGQRVAIRYPQQRCNPARATSRSPGSNAEESTITVALIDSAFLYEVHNLLVPQERICDEDLFCSTEFYGFLHLPATVCNSTFWEILRRISSIIFTSRASWSINQLLKGTFPDNLLHSSAPDPSCFNNNHLLQHCAGLVFRIFYKIILDKPGTGDNERTGYIRNMRKHPARRNLHGYQTLLLCHFLKWVINTFRTVLPEAEEFGFSFLDCQDMNNPIYRCLYRPVNPLKVYRPPVF